MESSILIIVVAFIALATLQILFFVARYKRVPPDKILVIFGRIGPQESEIKIEKSGGHFVWPVIQEFLFIDLKSREYSIELNTQDANNEFVKLIGKVNVATGSSNKMISNYLEKFKDHSESQYSEQLKRSINQLIKRYVVEKTKADLQLNLTKTEIGVSSELIVELENLGSELISFEALEIV